MRLSTCAPDRRRAAAEDAGVGARALRPPGAGTRGAGNAARALLFAGDEAEAIAAAEAPDHGGGGGHQERKEGGEGEEDEMKERVE